MRAGHDGLIEPVGSHSGVGDRTAPGDLARFTCGFSFTPNADRSQYEGLCVHARLVSSRTGNIRCPSCGLVMVHDVAKPHGWLLVTLARGGGVYVGGRRP